MVAREGVGTMRRWRERMDEVIDFNDVEDEELRRRRMGRVELLRRLGITGGMRERTGVGFGWGCSSTGRSVIETRSRGRVGALPSIWESIL